jgi:hypothetical protein
MAGKTAHITIGGLLLPQVEPGLYQIAPDTLITKDALQDAINGFIDRGGKITDRTGTGEKKLPEGCPGDCQNHHGLCVGEEVTP